MWTGTAADLSGLSLELAAGTLTETAPITVTLAAQTNEGGTVSTDFDINVIGVDEVLPGTGAANTIEGGGGDDTINARGGADTVFGVRATIRSKVAAAVIPCRAARAMT